MTHHWDGDKYVGEYRGVKYTLPHDPYPPNPREDQDWLGTMVCQHRRYDLGDKDGIYYLKHAIRDSRYYKDAWEEPDSRYYLGDASEPYGISKMLPRCKDILYLPLYLYDHGGITMSTGPFSCPWDSGQVGFIFVTADKVRDEYCVRTISKLRRFFVESRLRDEVKVYDHYLTGQVYGWHVGDETSYGYYGDDDAAHAAEEYIDGLTDEQVAELVKAQ